MTAKESIQQILADHPDKRNKLFCRGYYFTDSDVEPTRYPFYGIWKHEIILGKWHLLVSPQQTYTIGRHGHRTCILIGHAYDPMNEEWRETAILDRLAEATEADFTERLNDLTGIFTLIVIEEEVVKLIGDATCMQNAFYTATDGNIHISSHVNLLGDLLSPARDEYVSRLAGYRFFGLLGNSLPGDLTQYTNIKRLIPNHRVEFSRGGEVIVKRFYWPSKHSMPIEELADRVSAILHRNLRLIGRKFAHPAISVTGGVDSKTTLACANGLYDRFSYFSYTSNPEEAVDADAAKTICEKLGIPHKLYSIPDQDACFEDIELTRTLLLWNTGNLHANNPNDVRKRRFFEDTTDFDVEVKSWASEIGRAYFSKRFNGRTHFGKPTARKCTTLYKFFLHDRKLVRATDAVFRRYLENYFERHEKNPIDWQEQFFWEFRVPSWNGLVITGEHRYSFDITIPYNNRRILALLVSAPLQDRINDTVYQLIRTKMNPQIDEIGIHVNNVKHTHLRARLENMYYSVHSRIPF